MVNNTKQIISKSIGYYLYGRCSLDHGKSGLLFVWCSLEGNA